ncbi:MAG: hypothetical protein Ct9H300mP28_29080 [Pseudomonadota bacterium]|nr:MAG: hypothetical protein Ct9H300mP28_29080 [Pseudomonadota bacterium]
MGKIKINIPRILISIIFIFDQSGLMLLAVQLKLADWLHFPHQVL